MEKDFRISTEQRSAATPVTVFHVRGCLDAESEAQLLEAARIAYDEGARDLLVDLSELDTLTSAGMRALQKVYQIFTPREDHFKIAHLKLCNAPLQIYHILGITGFLHNIPMYENLESALQSFEKQ